MEPEPESYGRVRLVSHDLEVHHVSEFIVVAAKETHAVDAFEREGVGRQQQSGVQRKEAGDRACHWSTHLPLLPGGDHPHPFTVVLPLDSDFADWVRATHPLDT